MGNKDHRREQDDFPVLWGNPLSRRRLLSAGGVFLVATATGMSVACSSDSPSDSAGSGSGGSGEAGGSIDVALRGEVSEGLDPTTASDVAVAVNNFVYEALYRLDPFPPRVDVSPELATAMPEELSPTSYRITLREGVTFHDGSPLTADDVVFTIERIKDPATASFFARFFTFVERVEAVDEHTVELTLTAPTTLLAERLVLVKVISRAAVEASEDALQLEPVGSGPYQVVSARTGGGQQIRLQRFEDYSGIREVTYDEVTLHQVADPNARTSGLRSDGWKVIEDVPGSAFDGLAGASGVETESVPTTFTTMLMFHAGKPPFDDVRVRQAVLYAIDRDSITESSFFGQAEPAWTGHVRSDSADYTAPDLTYSYDPDRARDLLAQAGYGDGGIAIDLLIPSDVEYLTSQGPIIEQNLRDLGFTPNIVSQSLTSLVGEAAAGNHSVLLAITDPSLLGPADTEFILRWVYYGVFTREYSYWNGGEADALEALLDEAFTAADDDARRAKLAEVQNIIQEGVPIAPLHFRNQLTAWSSDLGGFEASPTAGIVLDGVTG